MKQGYRECKLNCVKFSFVGECKLNCVKFSFVVSE